MSSGPNTHSSHGRPDGVSRDGGRIAHDCDVFCPVLCWDALSAEIRQCRELLEEIGDTLSAARDALRWAGEVQHG